jgi:hypothetical protein
MDTSLPNSNPIPLSVEARERMELLSALSPDQLLECMRWLVRYSPGAVDAALSAVAPVPSIDPVEPAPVCGICGGDIGIFLKFGLEWRHYRGAGLGISEIFEPGHKPQLAWRRPDQGSSMA